MIPALGSCMAVMLIGITTPETNSLTPERIRELVKMLEEPVRLYRNGQPVPPDQPAPVRDFSWNRNAAELGGAGPVAIQPLIKLLQDKSKHSQARAQAAGYLTAHLIGWRKLPNSEVLAAVKSAIHDRDSAVRETVLQMLCVRGVNWNRGLAAPTPFTKTTLHPEVCRIILPEIITALSDQDPEVACVAAKAVYTLGQPNTGVGQLVVALCRKEDKVREFVLYAIGEVGRDDPAALTAVLQQLKRKDDVGTYRAAIIVVGRFGPKAKAAVPQLMEALRDPKQERHQNMPPHALKSLSEIGPDASAAVPLILDYIRSSPPFHNGPNSVWVEALESIDPKAAKQGRELERQLAEKIIKESEAKSPKLPPLLPNIPINPPRPAIDQ